MKNKNPLDFLVYFNAERTFRPQNLYNGKILSSCSLAYLNIFKLFLFNYLHPLYIDSKGLDIESI